MSSNDDSASGRLRTLAADAERARHTPSSSPEATLDWAFDLDSLPDDPSLSGLSFGDSLDIASPLIDPNDAATPAGLPTATPEAVAPIRARGKADTDYPPASDDTRPLDDQTPPVPAAARSARRRAPATPVRAQAREALVETPSAPMAWGILRRAGTKRRRS